MAYRFRAAAACAALAIGLIPAATVADEPDLSDILGLFGAMASIEPANLLVWRANILGQERSGHAALVDLPRMLDSVAIGLLGDADEMAAVEDLPRIILSMDPLGWDNPFGAMLGGMMGSDLTSAPSMLSLAESAVMIPFNQPGPLRTGRLPLVAETEGGPPPGAAFLGFVRPAGDGDMYRGESTSGELVITNVEGGLRGRYAAGVTYVHDDDPQNEMSGFVDGEFCEIGQDDLQAMLEAGQEVRWGVVECLFEEPEDFFVVDNAPRHGRENVITDAAPILVEFSAPVSPAEFDDHFELFTMDPNGEKIAADGSVTVLPGRQMSFEPTSPLEQGVIYEARIQGGEDGLESRDGETLGADHWWRFSTIIDYDEDDIDVSFYQTMRDAPLLRDKTTLTRVFVDWEERDDISSSWQPVSFPAEITAENPTDGDMYPHLDDHVYRIRRPDQHSAADRRHARNTSNLFDWRPGQRDGAVDVALEIEPYDPYPEAAEPPIKETEAQINMWPYEPRTLSLQYYMMPIGPWEDGMPGDEVLNAHLMAKGAETYTRQTMPIDALSTSYGGVLDPEQVVSPMVINRNDPLTIIRDTLLALQWEVLDRGLADILLLFTPAEWHRAGSSFSNQSGGQWWAESDPGDTGLRWIGAVIQAPLMAGLIDTNVITHEIGHSMGLDHSPDDGTWAQHDQVCAPIAVPSGAWTVDIEGFRIAASGTFGWNKSDADGNAESSLMEPLMHPCAQPQSIAFTRFADYRQLQSVPFLRSFASRSGGGRDDITQFASLWPGVVAFGTSDAPSGRQLRVVGRMLQTPDGTHAVIETVRPTRYSTPSNDGPLAAVLLDRGGEILARVAFGVAYPDQEDDSGRDPDSRDPDSGAADPDDPSTWPLFTVLLPDQTDADRIEIRDGDRLLAYRDRPVEAPRLMLEAETPPDAGDGPIRLAWSVENDAPVTATVMVSPDGEQGWRLVARNVTETGIDIDPSRIPAGPSPTLRVIVNDGFNEAAEDVAATVLREPVPLVTTPRGDAPADTMVDIVAVFQTDVDPDSLEQRFVVHDADGDPIAATLNYDDGRRAALLTPDSPLPDHATFVATLKAGIIDTYGNRLSRDIEWRFETGEGMPEVDDHDPFDHLPGGPPPEPGAPSPASRSSGDESGADTAIDPNNALVLGDETHPIDVDRCDFGDNAPNPRQIIAEGLSAETGETFSVVLQRHSIGPNLMETVQVSIDADVYNALRLRRDDTWQTASGAAAEGPLIDYDDGVFSVDGVASNEGRTEVRAFTIAGQCP